MTCNRLACACDGSCRKPVILASHSSVANWPDHPASTIASVTIPAGTLRVGEPVEVLLTLEDGKASLSVVEEVAEENRIAAESVI